MDKVRLSKEEQEAVARIKLSSRWDAFRYEMAYLIPSFVVIAVGVYYPEHRVLAPIGAFLYLVFHIRTLLYQKRMLPVWKSIMNKVEPFLDDPR